MVCVGLLMSVVTAGQTILTSQVFWPRLHVELPFVWPESPARARNESRDLAPSPIVDLVKKKPWLLANLYSGRIPQAASAA